MAVIRRNFEADFATSRPACRGIQGLLHEAQSGAYADTLALSPACGVNTALNRLDKVKADFAFPPPADVGAVGVFGVVC